MEKSTANDNKDANDSIVTPKKTKPTSSRKTKSRSPRNKENNSPKLDWRDANDSKKTATKKSSGISPEQFHGNSNNGSTRTRVRPGKDYVKAIHEQSEENVFREEKKEISKVQEVKRSAFRAVTSLKTWPLQDLAMKDYQQLMQLYLGEENNKNGVKEDPDYNHGASSESAASTDKKRIMTDKSLSPSKSQLKQRYKKEFLEELEIPDHNVVTVSYDPTSRFDPGLWSMEPRIFSTEKANGKRRYIVGNMGRVADLIWRKTDRFQRYFYELILEDAPCRLYFDLEYSIPDNPDIPPNQLLNELYMELVQALVIRFPNHCEGFSRNCIVDLDSSTPQKFSRHWIVHLPSKALFKNNVEAGKFVKAFIQKLADEVATGTLYDRCPCLHDFLFVNPKGTLKKKANDDNPKQELPLSKKSCFVDLGVYTRNRLFRLLGSAKFGKPADCALRLASSNQFPLPRGFGNDMFYVPAMVKSETEDNCEEDGESNIREGEVKRDKAIEKFKTQTDWSLHAQVLCRTLVVPLNWRKIDYPLLPEMEDETESNETKPSRQPTPLSNSARPTFGESPYPYIDRFVEDVLAIRGSPPIQGAIRAWTLVSGGDTASNGTGTNSPQVPVGISYQMLRNRWCECVGRHHKSNNVIWNIDFHHKKATQTCYDPECRAMNFRGAPIDLPYDVVEQLDDAMFESELAGLDEEVLLRGNASLQNTKSAKHSEANDNGLENAMSALSLGSSKVQPHASPGFDAALSDDALLEALESNPELFH
ncbi:directed primase/polymerase protein [Seminavis robusta]|uniref:DNA-directed primase/polymerase protein n=1 Tax=Seminavis robusta TaxID=568900 RepID=A0A9N8EGI3_9STRA|nr:directed primase/polymerase protein [Seminavis robusta]|eukprot:Sro1165_g248110.1 directed primase/polymerase protein (761) ;mRNA; r:18714-21092